MAENRTPSAGTMSKAAKAAARGLGNKKNADSINRTLEKKGAVPAARKAVAIISKQKISINGKKSTVGAVIRAMLRTKGERISKGKAVLKNSTKKTSARWTGLDKPTLDAAKGLMNLKFKIGKKTTTLGDALGVAYGKKMAGRVAIVRTAKVGAKGKGATKGGTKGGKGRGGKK